LFNIFESACFIGTEELCTNQYEVFKDDSEKENRSIKATEGDYS